MPRSTGRPLGEDSGQRAWFHELTPARLQSALPATIATRLSAGERIARTRWPRGVQRAVATKRKLLRQPADDGREFLDAALASDLVFISGAGAINDHFGGRLSRAFDLISLATDRGIPTALMGQGIGPLADGGVLAAAG